jgi:Na+/H+ antiporter
MNGLEITVLLGAAVLAGTVAAPRLRIAVPLLLVIIGLALGFVPKLREVELPPETVLLLFLPVMLFWESLTTSLRSIKRDFRGIVIMSTLLVVATAFGVAGIAYALGMPWDAALILGAALAPPDATAAAALGRILPHRQFMLLKAESLTNDGTALVVYAVAVGVAAGGHYTPLDITGLVLLSYLGGLASGALFAGVAYLVMRGLWDPIALNLALLLTPFVAYLAAELIGASGVLAVVVAGLVLSYVSGRISTAASRRQTESAWPLGAYLLNGALFVLIGLEVHSAASEYRAGDLGRLLGLVIGVWVALIVIRFVFAQAAVLVIRALDRRPSQRTRRMSYRARVVSTVAGVRGAVSLAIALSVPATLQNGAPFPRREEIVFVTAGVVLLTLMVQAPLLPPAVRWAKLPEDHDAEAELLLAEREISSAVAAALPELAREHGIGEEARRILARDYEEHLARAEADRLQTETRPDTLVDHEEYVRLRVAVLDRKREVLHRLRRTGAIDDSVARHIQTRLDIEELRLTGPDPME